MTRHDDRTRLLHMLDYAREAMNMAQSRQRADLDKDRTFCFALTHVVVIIGEAAAHVSEPLRQANANIPWIGIVGLRNRLIHGYSDVNLDVLWKIVQVELPPLVRQIEAILGKEI